MIHASVLFNKAQAIAALPRLFNNVSTYSVDVITVHGSEPFRAALRSSEHADETLAYIREITSAIGIPQNAFGVLSPQQEAIAGTMATILANHIHGYALYSGGNSFERGRVVDGRIVPVDCDAVRFGELNLPGDAESSKIIAEKFRRFAWNQYSGQSNLCLSNGGFAMAGQLIAARIRQDKLFSFGSKKQLFSLPYDLRFTNAVQELIPITATQKDFERNYFETDKCISKPINDTLRVIRDVCDRIDPDREGRLKDIVFNGMYGMDYAIGYDLLRPDFFMRDTRPALAA